MNEIERKEKQIKALKKVIRTDLGFFVFTIFFLGFITASLYLADKPWSGPFGGLLAIICCIWGIGFIITGLFGHIFVVLFRVPLSLVVLFFLFIIKRLLLKRS